MTPPWVLDYVVVHEVAHLPDFSHSARFWDGGASSRRPRRPAAPGRACTTRELRHALDSVGRGWWR